MKQFLTVIFFIGTSLTGVLFLPQDWSQLLSHGLVIIAILMWQSASYKNKLSQY